MRRHGFPWRCVSAYWFRREISSGVKSSELGSVDVFLCRVRTPSREAGTRLNSIHGRSQVASLDLVPPSRQPRRGNAFNYRPTYVIPRSRVILCLPEYDQSQPMDVLDRRRIQIGTSFPISRRCGPWRRERVFQCEFRPQFPILTVPSTFTVNSIPTILGAYYAPRRSRRRTQAAGISYNTITCKSNFLSHSG